MIELLEPATLLILIGLLGWIIVGVFAIKMVKEGRTKRWLRPVFYIGMTLWGVGLVLRYLGI